TCVGHWPSCPTAPCRTRPGRGPNGPGRRDWLTRTCVPTPAAGRRNPPPVEGPDVTVQRPLRTERPANSPPGCLERPSPIGPPGCSPLHHRILKENSSVRPERVEVPPAAPRPSSACRPLANATGGSCGGQDPCVSL